MRNKTMIISTAIAVPSILAAMVSWNTLDLPRPASSHEVQTVQQYAASTREIVLNQEWFRISRQLEVAEARLAQNPGNPRMIDEVVRLRQALQNVNAQLRKLR